MNGLVLVLILSQATEFTISATVVRPTCVVIDASGEAKVVPRRRSLDVGALTAACTSSSGANAPRVEKHVQVAETAEGPELRVVEINY